MGFLRRLFTRPRGRPAPSAGGSPIHSFANPLTLPQYKQILSSLPSPTRAQKQGFAEFVSNAHSWYKHAPLFPPGIPLQLFLDPGAGMQLVSKGGPLEAVPRLEPGFHYSWLPTQEYRDRFGYLAFSRSSGTSVSLLAGGSHLIGSDEGLGIYEPTSRRLLQLPAEVLEAGRAFITGMIHTLGAEHSRWQLYVERVARLELPEEGGGSETIAKIRERCRELRDDPSRLEQLKPGDPRLGRDFGLLSVDFPLYQILEPERRRQRAGLIAAMERVIDLVAADSA